MYFVNIIRAPYYTILHRYTFSLVLLVRLDLGDKLQLYYSMLNSSSPLLGTRWLIGVIGTRPIQLQFVSVPSPATPFILSLWPDIELSIDTDWIHRRRRVFSFMSSCSLSP